MGPEVAALQHFRVAVGKKDSGGLSVGKVNPSPRNRAGVIIDLRHETVRLDSLAVFLPASAKMMAPEGEYGP